MRNLVLFLLGVSVSCLQAESSSASWSRDNEGGDRNNGKEGISARKKLKLLRRRASLTNDDGGGSRRKIWRESELENIHNPNGKRMNRHDDRRSPSSSSVSFKDPFIALYNQLFGPSFSLDVSLSLSLSLSADLGLDSADGKPQKKRRDDDRDDFSMAGNRRKRIEHLAQEGIFAPLSIRFSFSLPSAFFDPIGLPNAPPAPCEEQFKLVAEVIDFTTDRDGKVIPPGMQIWRERTFFPGGVQFDGRRSVAKSDNAFNAGMIYDTALLRGPDKDDLGQQPLQGNVLIITSDWNSDAPNDYRFGGVLRATFPYPATVLALALLDVEEGATLEFFDQVYDTFSEAVPFQTIHTDGGTNGDIRRIIVGVYNVRVMHIVLQGSGAIDNLEFIIGTPLHNCDVDTHSQ